MGADDGPPGKGSGESAVGRLLDVEVGPVAHGGHCVARHSGRVVFVRHALPGERVRARVTEGSERSRYWRADAVEVVEPAPDRVVPPCPYAGPGRCGGCDWQHVDPAAQRRLKSAVLAEQLHRLAGLDLSPQVEELPGAPDGPWWRTRVRFSVDADGRAGFRRHRSHEVQPVDACLIAHPLVEGVGVERRRWPGVASVDVAVSVGTGQRVCTVTHVPGADATVPEVPADVAVAVTGSSARRPRPGRGGGGSTGEVEEVAAGRRFTVSAAGFWQVHPAAADTLVEAVLAGLQPRPGDMVLDLYAGAGLFAAALAAHVLPGGQVVAVESDPVAVADARVNLGVLGDRIDAVVVRGRVDRLMATSGRARHPRLRRTDLVVLDPPRSGAGARVVTAVTGLRPRRVAYVACDPAALARDLATFADRGYRIALLRAFDLFPMTGHVEALAVLAR